MTNFEKIKSMTKEELTRFLDAITGDDDATTIDISCKGCMNYETHHYYDKSDMCGGCSFHEIGADIAKWLDCEWRD